MLRAYMLPFDGTTAQQKIQDQRDVEFALLLHPLGTSLSAVRRQVLENFGQSYPLFRIQAVQLPDGKVHIFFLFDLLICDAQSLNILTDELSRLYLEGPKIELPKLDLTFQQYVLLRAKLKDNNPTQVQKEEAYWLSKTSVTAESGGLPSCPQLPVHTQAPQRHTIQRMQAKLEPEKWQMLREHGRSQGLTDSQLLLAVYSRVLATWSTSPHFIMNLAYFNRDVDIASVNNIVGNCAGTILVEIDGRGDVMDSFTRFAKTVKLALLESMEHSQFTSGVDVMSQLNTRDGTRGRAVAPYVFASVLDVSGGSGGNIFNWFGKTPVSSALSTPQVYIDQQVFEDVDGSLCFNWDLQDLMFPEGLVKDMFEAYQSLLLRLATDPSAWRDDVSLVPAQHLSGSGSTSRWNEQEVDPELEASLELLHVPMLREASANPEKPAVIDASGITLSFGKLEMLAASYCRQILTLASDSRNIGILLYKGTCSLV